MVGRGSAEYRLKLKDRPSIGRVSAEGRPKVGTFRGECEFQTVLRVIDRSTLENFRRDFRVGNTDRPTRFGAVRRVVTPDRPTPTQLAGAAPTHDAPTDRLAFAQEAMLSVKGLNFTAFTQKYCRFALSEPWFGMFLSFTT